MRLPSLLDKLATSYSILQFFFFNHPATTEIYTLSLHDALPICIRFPSITPEPYWPRAVNRATSLTLIGRMDRDRKSTRLNSSHLGISYAVFCLKKKKKESTTKCQKL